MTPVAASQAESRAAGEDEGIEGIGVGQGREQAGLPRGGAAAADVDAAGVRSVEQDDGDAGHGLLVLALPKRMPWMSVMGIWFIGTTPLISMFF